MSKHSNDDGPHFLLYYSFIETGFFGRGTVERIGRRVQASARGKNTSHEAAERPHLRVRIGRSHRLAQGVGSLLFLTQIEHEKASVWCSDFLGRKGMCQTGSEPGMPVFDG